MAAKTNIGWCDATWNFARGCTKVDADCKFCYMFRDSYNGTRYDPGVVTRAKTVFDLPLRYKETKSKVWKGRPLMFSPSLSDVFHKDVDPFRDEVLAIVKQCPHIIFQMLTKRPERITPDWYLENVWLGTSVGSNASRERIVSLIQAPAYKRFLSLEPMHGYVNLKGIDLGAIDWIILGGESGNESGKYRYRPSELAWYENILTIGQLTGVPIFMKQLGTYQAKQLNLKDRHGRDMSEWPKNLQVRQFPL